VQALHVCTLALRTLHDTTAALRCHSDRISPVLWVSPGAVEPFEPEAPVLLPSVHLFWSPLVGALKVSSELHPCNRLTQDQIRVLNPALPPLLVCRTGAQRLSWQLWKRCAM
jgi:hypothetical protein